MTEKLLEIKNLTTVFNTGNGPIKAVDDLSIYLNKGEILGLVGESGCGKSVTSLSVMGLIPSPPGKIESGSILYKGEDLVRASTGRLRTIRGNEIAMIFQEPMTSLNPVFTVGNQISEVVEIHEKLSRKEALPKVIKILNSVSIPEPEQRYHEYPHQLSGGMRQRIMIAMALVCNPELLIADEPTTALDVTIQAQILELLLKLRSDFGLSVLLITHDLGVVAETADRVAVMYAGRLVEEAPVKDLFAKPLHPYTKGLLESVPVVSSADSMDSSGKRLKTIPGTVPSLHNLPEGCTFAPRCPLARPECKKDSNMKIRRIDSQRSVRCVLFNED